MSYHFIARAIYEFYSQMKSIHAMPIGHSGEDSSSNTDILSGSYNITLKSQPNYQIHIREKDIHIIDTKRSSDIDSSNMKLSFKEFRGGYKIKNNFGSLCKESRIDDPRIKNCYEQPNRYGAWNIHSKNGGFIFESKGFCLHAGGQVKKDANRGGRYWNLLDAQKCDPRQTEDSNYLFSIKKVRGPNYESRSQRMIREEQEQDSSSNSDDKDNSDDSSSSDTDRMHEMLCAHNNLPPDVMMGPHFQGFSDIFNPC